MKRKLGTGALEFLLRINLFKENGRKELERLYEEFRGLGFPLPMRERRLASSTTSSFCTTRM